MRFTLDYVWLVTLPNVWRLQVPSKAQAHCDIPWKSGAFSRSLLTLSISLTLTLNTTRAEGTLHFPQGTQYVK